jgi:maltooligosyltrehalose trehalohydrolase
MSRPPHPMVWAPTAAHVELVVDRPDGVEARLAMHPAPGDGPDALGWWEPAESLAPGTRYRFDVDGTVAPDPRSAWQPEGVDGPSVVIDHDAFTWTDNGWRAEPLDRAVLYELHVGTFSPEGTYDGVRQRLDHLVELGVTHLEVLPLATFDGRHGWGYDGVGLFAPHPSYGTPDDLKRLIDACHQRGLAVLIDVVYNHLGPTGNHLGSFGPYFTDRYETPWGQAVNLDGNHSPGVRRFIVDNALMWLRDYHADGLRLDAVHELLDTSATHILEELAEAVADLSTAVDRPLVLIAENDTNDPRLVLPREAGGFGLDAHWCDDVHHAIHTALTGEADGYYADYVDAEGYAALERALQQGYVYDGRWSPARERVVGRSPDPLLGRNLVACIQNHDQVGNRARGERLHEIASPDAQKVAATLLLTAPFVPLLFQGEEWASSSPFPYFADHSDAELVDAVRQGRLEEFTAFGWEPEEVLDPESRVTYETAKLRWEERSVPAHAEMVEWYRTLIALRRSTPDLLDDRLGQVVVEADGDSQTVVVRRGAITVAANLSDDDRDVVVEGTVVVSSRTVETPPQDGSGPRHRLPPMSAAVFRR